MPAPESIQRSTQLAVIGFRAVKQILGLRGEIVATADAILEAIEKVVTSITGSGDKQRIAVEDEIAKLVTGLRRNDDVADAALEAKFDHTDAEPGAPGEPGDPKPANEE